MIAHFICTKGDFPYFFYLTIKTTLKVSSFNKIMIWCTDKEPQNNHYFNELVDARGVSVALFRGMTANTARYSILFEYPGFYMDWDSITVKDIVPILRDSDYFTFFQTKHGWDFLKAYPDSSPASILTCSYIYARKRTSMMKRALELAVDFESKKELSPACKAFYQVVSKTREFWRVGSNDIVNPFWFHADSFKEDKNMVYPQETCIDHWYYSNHPDFREKITPEFIRTSQCLYARTVRRIL